MSTETKSKLRISVNNSKRKVRFKSSHRGTASSLSPHTKEKSATGAKKR